MLKMLSCREETALLSQALDRPLRLHERFGMRLHLLFCKGCRATRRRRRAAPLAPPQGPETRPPPGREPSPGRRRTTT